MRTLGRWLVAGVVLLLARRRPPAPGERRPRILPPGTPSPRAELAVAGLLGVAALAAAGFIAAYVVSGDTQLLGLSLGLALASLAAAFTVAGKRLVPQETVEELHEPPPDAVAEEEVVQIIGEGGDPVSRRRLLVVAGGAAGTMLVGALVVPLASLGPSVGDRLYRSPWQRGRRLVDERDEPIASSDLEVGSFVTAFAEDASKRVLATAVIVVRVRADELELPAERANWAPDGILAFSKICTHAGCAVSLFRYPLYEPTSAGPALVCPCHYSTFDVPRGGEVVFGPASRPLPQLPLGVDEAGHLVAAGDFSDAVGPSWWGIELR